MVMVKGYFSYLLRLWQTSAAGGTVWRASLMEILTGEHRSFASVEELLGYLRQRAQAGSLPEEMEGRKASIPGSAADGAVLLEGGRDQVPARVPQDGPETHTARR
jgi:hypothetical protein